MNTVILKFFNKHNEHVFSKEFPITTSKELEEAQKVYFRHLKSEYRYFVTECSKEPTPAEMALLDEFELLPTKYEKFNITLGQD